MHIMVVLDPTGGSDRSQKLWANRHPNWYPQIGPQVRTPNPPWLQNGSEKGTPRMGDIPHEALCKVFLERVSDRT